MTGLHQGAVRGRYAPSPTGPQHLGNLRTALLGWLQTRLQSGTFVLRMEDLDLPRVVDGSAEEILSDLRWLGLDWDEGPDVGGPFAPYTQSERTELYGEALDRLIEDGRAYPCWCSRKDIREASSAPHAAALIYPGTCRGMTPQERGRRRDQRPDRHPAWRFAVADEVVELVDEIAGPFEQNLERDVGDFVLRRADDLFAYQHAVVVDDIAMAISDVLRGVDLLDSTPRQVALWRALGASEPTFWHVPLMLDDDGVRMSKRDGSLSLRALREGGATPESVVGLLARSAGLTDARALSARQLLESLDIDDFRRRLRA